MPGREDSSYALVSACRRQDLYRAGRRGNKAQRSFRSIREEIGAEDIDEVAFAWLFSHPAKPIPITGSGEIGLAERPVKALKYRLTPEQWFMIWTAVKGHKVP